MRTGATAPVTFPDRSLLYPCSVPCSASHNSCVSWRRFGVTSCAEGVSPQPLPLQRPEIPENFPVRGNSITETGSRESAHTATDLGGRRQRLRMCRFRREMRAISRCAPDRKAPNPSVLAHDLVAVSGEPIRRSLQLAVCTGRRPWVFLAHPLRTNFRLGIERGIYAPTARLNDPIARLISSSRASFDSICCLGGSPRRP